MCPAGSPVVLIIVPAYNAGKYLSELILRIKNSAPKSDILVVDDGSTDETSDILKSSNVIVLVNSSNKGKGYSLQRGFDYAIENNYDYVITLDADCSRSGATRRTSADFFSSFSRAFKPSA